IGPTGVFARGPEHGRLFSTNHFLTEERRESRMSLTYLSSHRRLSTAEKKCQAAEKIDVPLAIEGLRAGAAGGWEGRRVGEGMGVKAGALEIEMGGRGVFAGGAEHGRLFSTNHFLTEERRESRMSLTYLSSHRRLSTAEKKCQAAEKIDVPLAIEGLRASAAG